MGMTNRDWLFSLPLEEQIAWMNAEHVQQPVADASERVTNQAEMLHIDASDGDTDALERKSADLIYEYYKPMVAELQAQVDELKERADYNSHGWAKANICWAEANAEAEKWRMKCDEYRNKFGKCLDYADAIHALMDDEGIA